MAGEVLAAGPAAGSWGAGERVCALLPGAGYAQLSSVPAGLLMRIPPNLSFEEAAAIPEAFLTAYRNLVVVGALSRGQTVLIHAGASGVGTAAIQLAREIGATSFVTAGSPERISRCLSLGARAGWDRHEGPFAPWVAAVTGRRGVDVVLDCVGARYFEQNIDSLAADGKLVVIGTMGGSLVDALDLRALMSKRLQISGAALRSMSTARKIDLTRGFAEFALPRFADGRLRPVIDSVYDWKDVSHAHERMEAGLNFGKIVLRVEG
jgi:NADPH:quinone reductase-like Zn-dependent oxidoreductase